MIDVLFSGGMDSWIHLNWAIGEFGSDRVRAVYIDGVVDHVEELAAANKLALMASVRLTVIRVFLYVKIRRLGISTGRNLIFILRVAALEDSEGVVFGRLTGASEDKNEKFVVMVNSFRFSVQTKSVRAGQRFKIYLHSVIRFQDSDDNSIYQYPSNRAIASIRPIRLRLEAMIRQCGRCQSCFNRWVALYNNGITREFEQAGLPYVGYPYDWMDDEPLRGDLGLLWHKRRALAESYRALYRYGREVRKQNVLMEFARRL